MPLDLMPSATGAPAPEAPRQAAPGRRQRPRLHRRRVAALGRGHRSLRGADRPRRNDCRRSRRLPGRTPGGSICRAGTVVPGFNDSHVHLVDGGTELTERRSARREERRRRWPRGIARAARKQPKGRWILGGFWDHERWPGQQLPTRALIDAVTPDNPVFVQRLDGHMGWPTAWR